MHPLLESYIAVANGSKTRLYVAFICLCATVVTLSGQPQRLWQLWQISERPASAQGQVKSLDCANHGHVFYAYQVGSEMYPGDTFALGGAGCRKLRVGQPVTVFYESGEPRNSYTSGGTDHDPGQPKSEFWTGVPFLAAFVFLAPLFLVLVWTAFSKVLARFA